MLAHSSANLDASAVVSVSKYSVKTKADIGFGVAAALVLCLFFDAGNEVADVVEADRLCEDDLPEYVDECLSLGRLVGREGGDGIGAAAARIFIVDASGIFAICMADGWER